MIEVRIPHAELDAIENPVHKALRVERELVDAGIPIKRGFIIQQVERGRLTTYTDDMFNDLVYEWEDA